MATYTVKNKKTGEEKQFGPWIFENPSQLESMGFELVNPTDADEYYKTHDRPASVSNGASDEVKKRLVKSVPPVVPNKVNEVSEEELQAQELINPLEQEQKAETEAEAKIEIPIEDKVEPEIKKAVSAPAKRGRKPKSN